MIFFPNAKFIRDEVLFHATSFDGLAEMASIAIIEAAKSGYNFVDIPYEHVSQEEHMKFHSFIFSKGFRGGKTQPARSNGRLVYRIHW